nr:hypothetical protein [Tanacetum cinerariifolium]
MVAAAKLSVLNPVNDDSPPPIRTVDGVEQTYPPTTTKEKLARKNKLKARGTLLMALLNEHQLKFNSYKNAKSLMDEVWRVDHANIKKNAFVEESRYKPVNNDHLTGSYVFAVKQGSGPTWLFDIDTLTKSMNYKPVVAEKQSNGSVGDEEKKDDEDPENEDNEVLSTEEPRVNQKKDANVNNTNNINTVSPTTNAASTKDNAVDENIVYGGADDLNMPNLEEIVYSNDDEDVGTEAGMTHLDTNIPVSPILTTRIHKDHRVEQIIRDIHSTPQTRIMTNSVTDHVWTLVDLPYGKRAIETKWIYRNKKDKRGIMVRIKARIVAQGYNQENGIDYDEVFAPVARIKPIRLFLAYISFKDFVMYQMDVKSVFLYGKIEEEVYVCQPLGSKDLEFTDRVYKVEKALYCLHQVPRAWEMCIEFEKMMHKKFQMSSMGELTFFLGLQTTSTPMETSKPLMKDENAEDEAYTDSDYSSASLDRKSTTGGCQFLKRRLISWQCKKQTIVANSTTEAEYVAASNCYGQVLWIQNQMLDYGYNFINTKIFIDNESTICIVKNHVFHSKTNHIEIRHHFIKDSYEKRLIL